MVTTYLAMLREGAAIADHDRRFVMESLFRHSASGMVKDDANPPFVWNSILRKPD